MTLSCEVYFSSNDQAQNRAFYEQNGQIQFFFSPLKEFKLRTVGIY